jgi:hypothetical protein
VEPLDGDTIRPERARERLSAGAERGGAAPGVDRSVSDRSGAQPAVLLRRQLHSAPRARLHHTCEPLHAWIVPPLWGEAAQLRPNAILHAPPSSVSARGSWGSP